MLKLFDLKPCKSCPAKSCVEGSGVICPFDAAIDIENNNLYHETIAADNDVSADVASGKAAGLFNGRCGIDIGLE